MKTRSGSSRNNKRLVTGLLCIIFTIIAAYIWFRYEFTLEIKITGEQETVIEYGQTYHDPGAKLLLYGKHFAPQDLGHDLTLQVDSNVDESRLGSYFVHYTTSFLGIKASASRTVLVVDTQKPVITLLGSSEVIMASQVPYQEEGFSATDNYDGDISLYVTRQEYPGRIEYTVTDSSGNTATTVRLLTEEAEKVPGIWVCGDAQMKIDSGTPFLDPGAVAWSLEYGDLTDEITVTGEVIWYLPGTYELTYSVTDGAGNTVYTSRSIEVVARPRSAEVIPDGKVIYLTFDDGPSEYTPMLLDTLDRYNVKATFFVVDSGYDDIMRQIVQRGHSIGIHTVSHDYAEIYASPDAFFKDLFEMQKKIYDATGIMTTLMRFPGGGSNTISASSPGIMSLLTQAVQDAGFQYFDWNVDSNDAGGATSKRTVLNNMIEAIQKQQLNIVLQHDIHGYSVEAVEELIQWALENGYRFEKLDPSSPGVHHSVRN